MERAQSRNPIRRIATSLQVLRQQHQERHRPTGFGFAFADRIDYLDPQKWDAVTNCNTLFLRRSVLRTIEEHGPENIQSRYAMIFRSGEPVAALSVQIVSVNKEHFRFKKKHEHKPSPAELLKRALTPAAKLATANLRERLLVAGNLLSWGFHGIAFAPGVEHAELWPGIAEALYRIRRAERLVGQTNFVMLKDFTSEQSGLEALERFSYREMETEPNMILTIDPAWQTYDDYLAALDASYRRNAKTHGKKLAGAGCTLEQVSDLSSCAKRLHELYLAVHDNAAVRLVTLSENYLPALARAAGPNFRCTLVRRGEEILGFVTSLKDGDTAIAYYIGFRDGGPADLSATAARDD